MKKIPIILLLITPYVFVGICLSKGLGTVIPVIWLVLWLLILLPNMVYAFILPKLKYTGEQLLFWNMLLKLCNIPIYLMVFFVVLLLHVLILPLIPIFILFDYSLLLPSTMYGISGIICCYKDGKLTIKEVIVHIILQLMFYFDVFSAVYCYIRARKASSRTAL